MKILFLLIPLSLLLVVVAVLAFFWAVRSGQFEDLESPGYRILLDEHEPGDGEDSQSSERAPDAADESSGPDRR